MSLFKKKGKLNKEDRELLLTLSQVKENMDMTSMYFEYATDTKLIDIYIYELKALQMKYEFLMQKAKQRGLSADKIRVTAN